MTWLSTVAVTPRTRLLDLPLDSLPLLNTNVGDLLNLPIVDGDAPLLGSLGVDLNALTIAAAEACGGKMGPALPYACAVECIHTYSLIQQGMVDSILSDKAEERRTMFEAINLPVDTSGPGVRPTAATASCASSRSPRPPGSWSARSCS